MSQIIPIKIPTYISAADFAPARVLPRLLFYNGLVECEQYYIESGSLTQSGASKEQTAFPYFDNYNVVTGSFPTVNSKSLLFTNEAAAYGEVPTGSLYTEYWSKYISLLYNPRTRLVTCEAIIPLADYFKMELNDIVQWRGNYYHLRAINDYNLSNGECNLQLLGPILDDIIPNILPQFACAFDYTIGCPPIPTTTAAPTTTLAPTTTTTSPPVYESQCWQLTNNTTSSQGYSYRDKYYQTITGTLAPSGSVGSKISVCVEDFAEPQFDAGPTVPNLFYTFVGYNCTTSSCPTPYFYETERRSCTIDGCALNEASAQVVSWVGPLTVGKWYYNVLDNRAFYIFNEIIPTDRFFFPEYVVTNDYIQYNSCAEWCITPPTTTTLTPTTLVPTTTITPTVLPTTSTTTATPTVTPTTLTPTVLPTTSTTTATPTTTAAPTLNFYRYTTTGSYGESFKDFNGVTQIFPQDGFVFEFIAYSDGFNLNNPGGLVLVTPNVTPTFTSYRFQRSNLGLLGYVSWQDNNGPVNVNYALGAQLFVRCAVTNTDYENDPGNYWTITNLGSCSAPTTTVAPTTTTTTPPVTSFGGCGYGSSVAAACNDAGINNRTLYSNCDSGTFGVGCFVYVDTFPNALTGYTNVFMNGASWDVNSSTGQVTAYSSEQC